jgi:hypothetical protein
MIKYLYMAGKYIMGGLAAIVLLILAYQLVTIPGNCGCPFFSCFIPNQLLENPILNQPLENQCISKEFSGLRVYLFTAPLLLLKVAGMFVED